MPYQEQQLQHISKQFQIYGEIQHAETFKIGHINETYSATYAQGGASVRYIHQKINKNVFKHPPTVMKNLVRVTSHIRKKLEAAQAEDITRRSLIVIPTRDGHSYYENADGDYWRTFVFIEGVETFESVQSPPQAFEAGRAFGEFQLHLVDLPDGRLLETIPDFHHTKKRFVALQQAVQKDHYNRAKEAKKEIAFAEAHASIVDVILQAMEKGAIPERVTHNDTKFNNVMLDTQTGLAKCVVDLDTVMPGCALYDFGDMVRTTTSQTLEDERDLSKVEDRCAEGRGEIQVVRRAGSTHCRIIGRQSGHCNNAGEDIAVESGQKQQRDIKGRPGCRGLQQPVDQRIAARLRFRCQPIRQQSEQMGIQRGIISGKFLLFTESPAQSNLEISLRWGRFSQSDSCGQGLRIATWDRCIACRC